jgi:pullulanase/glycogen debranching enzyme
MMLEATTGRSSPQGATIVDGGVNFSLFSRLATGVELLLFDGEEDLRPARAIRVANRTYHYWHIFVPGIKPGQIYGYRVEGPLAPDRGLRFDASKVLLDPYGPFCRWHNAAVVNAARRESKGHDEIAGALINGPSHRYWATGFATSCFCPVRSSPTRIVSQMPRIVSL